MKKGILVLAALALTMSAGNALACGDKSACAGKCVIPPEKRVQAGGGSTHAAPKKDAKTTTVKLEVLGMECANCADHVTKGLMAVPGVEGVNVSLESGLATVDYNASKVKDTAVLVKAVEKAGYDAKVAPKAPVKATH